MSITEASALQHQASNPAQHVWVSASAGSGKTTVLVNRLLRLLIGDELPAPAAAHRILCLTYTKAAAMEMQLRLEKHLMHWATAEAKTLDADLEKLTGKMPDETLRRRARSLFADVIDAAQSLRIQTIHGFCQSVLARFPVEAGISPGFTALDDIEANALLHQALENVWRQDGGAAWRDAKSWLGARYTSADQLKKLVPGLMRSWHEMAALIPDEDAEEYYWRNCFAALGVPENETAHWEILLCNENLPMDALRVWAAEKDNVVLFDFLAATTGQRAAAWESYWELFFTQKDEPLKRLPKDLAAEPLRLLQIKDQRLAAASAAMGILLARLQREYQRLKTQQGALDFADMIELTRALLTQSDMGAWVHYKLDGGIDHILLDEAQDTAPLQWQVIRTLAEEFFTGASAADRPRSLFIVGDPKQSIYSFQGADSSLFREVELDIAARAEAAETQLQKLPLSYSFRTAPNLLAWVDQTFADADRSLALQGHSDAIRHHAIHEKRTGAARIYPTVPEIRSKKEKTLWAETDDADNTHNARLAAQIAETVRGWLQSGRRVAGEEAPLQPRDILILLQERTTLADALQYALAAAGVPVMGSDRLKLSDAPAVCDIFALCKFLLFPDDHLNLAIALRTPFINLPETELEKLSAARGDQSLWQALNANPQHAAIADYLKNLLNSADRNTAYGTLAEIIFMPCPASAQSGLAALHARLGAAVDDPVNELLQLVQREGEMGQPLSLGAFISGIETSNREVKREMAQQNQNVVRILTVHGAKGLEAKTVILADASALPFAHGSKQAKAVKHDGDVPYFLFASGKAEEGPAFDRSENRGARAAEHQRLLYVAMTRASHELHVFGKSNTKDEVKENSWYQQLRAALQNLGAAQDEHKIWRWGAADEFAAIIKPTATEKISPATPAPVETENAVQPIAITKYVQQQTRAAMRGHANPLAAERGTAIHRLLELLPNVDALRRAERAQRFLQNTLPDLKTEHLQITQQVLQTIGAADTHMFFGANARAEVPIAGYWQGVPVEGKIDRIYVTEDELGILDFKTGEPPRDSVIPEPHKLQVRIYADLLAEIYPNRVIRTGILWTNNGKTLWLPDAERAAA